jgi:hypothetical protein
MRNAIFRGLVSVLLFIFFFVPLSFCVTYFFTNSIGLSLFSVIAAYIMWRLIFGGGLKKRRYFVDTLLNSGFPVSNDDPLLASKDSLQLKSWIRGNGYTNEVDQPILVKVNETGIALLYLCRASKNPFIIPWERLSRISLKQSQSVEGGLLARLFIPGIGMEILIPWNMEFNRFVPGQIAFDK